MFLTAATLHAKAETSVDIEEQTVAGDTNNISSAVEPSPEQESQNVSDNADNTNLNIEPSSLTMQVTYEADIDNAPENTTFFGEGLHCYNADGSSATINIVGEVHSLLSGALYVSDVIGKLEIVNTELPSGFNIAVVTEWNCGHNHNPLIYVEGQSEIPLSPEEYTFTITLTDTVDGEIAQTSEIAVVFDVQFKFQSFDFNAQMTNIQRSTMTVATDGSIVHTFNFNGEQSQVLSGLQPGQTLLLEVWGAQGGNIGGNGGYATGTWTVPQGVTELFVNVGAQPPNQSTPNGGGGGGGGTDIRTVNGNTLEGIESRIIVGGGGGGRGNQANRMGGVGGGGTSVSGQVPINGLVGPAGGGLSSSPGVVAAAGTITAGGNGGSRTGSGAGGIGGVGTGGNGGSSGGSNTTGGAAGGGAGFGGGGGGGGHNSSSMAGGNGGGGGWRGGNHINGGARSGSMEAPFQGGDTERTGSNTWSECGSGGGGASGTPGGRGGINSMVNLGGFGGGGAALSGSGGGGGGWFGGGGGGCQSGGGGGSSFVAGHLGRMIDAETIAGSRSGHGMARITIMPNVLETTTVTVSKTVEGEFANMTLAFEFTIYLYDSEDNPFPANTEIAYNDGNSDGTLILDAAGSAKFLLTHGQTITIKDLPLGGFLQINETPVEGYATSFIDSENPNDPIDGNDTTKLPIVEDRTFRFTNERIVAPPTALDTGDIEPLLLLAVSVCSIAPLACMINLRKRR